MNIAIIPARGGSKRIPRKNIQDFCGKPMIAYAIEAAKKSGLFDHVVVTTDSEEISKVAVRLGAEVPFMRPTKLADDYTETVPVIAHCIEACQHLGWDFNHVCCIYPGVPLIEISDLKGAFELLASESVGYSFPIAEFPSAIQRALKLTKNGKTQPFYPEFELARTQELVPAYYDAGQFYWAKAETWLSNSKIHSSSLGFIIPSWRVVDIDTQEDWLRAEQVYNSINRR